MFLLLSLLLININISPLHNITLCIQFGQCSRNRIQIHAADAREWSPNHDRNEYHRFSPVSWIQLVQSMEVSFRGFFILHCQPPASSIKLLQSGIPLLPQVLLVLLRGDPEKIVGFPDGWWCEKYFSRMFLSHSALEFEMIAEWSGNNLDFWSHDKC